jgi:hypothetical protein
MVVAARAYYTDGEAARSSTACRACGAAAWAMAARDRRSVGQQAARWTTRRPSSSATRCPSSWPTGSRSSRPPGWTTCSSPARLGGRRHLAEDGARLLAPEGPGQQDAPDRREKGYHGVNFGGISVGGMVGNRKVRPGHRGGPPAAHAAAHGQLHQGHARRRGRAAGRPPAGLIALHDASNIAAVIVEPFSARPAW